MRGGDKGSCEAKSPMHVYIEKFTNMHPNIIYYDKTLSDYDFEIDIEIENRKKLLELLAEIKSKFHIRNIEILSFKEYYKLELIPG